MPQGKIALFVDGAAMFYAQKDIRWHIDWRRVYHLYTDNRDVYGAFYFTASPSPDRIEQLKKYRSFRAALIYMGYSVIDKEVRVIQDKNTGQIKVKGNLDIELVFRMLSGIDGYDDAILFGGDSDYIPIVHHLRNLGKEVTIVGNRPNTALDLINAATRYIDLSTIKARIVKKR